MRSASGLGRKAFALLAAISLTMALAACGSSGSGSGNAQNLLRQTFSGSHTVDSGVLSLGIQFGSGGASSGAGPISLTLNGPFQSRGSGKLPQSNLTLSIDGYGHHGQLGIISTGTTGYVRLDGVAYQLPAADYSKLSTSFSSAGSGSTVGGLPKLGIHPLHWLTNPSVVGPDNVGGTATTHIRAGVNVASLLEDLNTFLHKASATGASSTIPSTLSPATRQKIAAEVKNPSVDIWTGTTDHTLRKLTIDLSFPVSAQFGALLGGSSTAAVALTLQYADLNQPQTIVAPGNVKPFAGFETKLRSVIAQAEGIGLGGTGSSSSGSSGSTGSSSSTGSAGSASSVNKYSKCIKQAGSDISKMQKCASLLNGSGG